METCVVVLRGEQMRDFSANWG